MALAHPILGALVVAATVFLAGRGLVARQGARGAADARRQHRRVGPWVLGGMWLALASGLASTLLLREDLALGETWHLAVGVGTTLGMTATWLATRAFARGPRVRTVHLALGLWVVFGALLQAFLGIELLP